MVIRGMVHYCFAHMKKRIESTKHQPPGIGWLKKSDRRRRRKHQRFHHCFSGIIIMTIQKV
jgi:hypothetical protein